MSNYCEERYAALNQMIASAETMRRFTTSSLELLTYDTALKAMREKMAEHIAFCGSALDKVHTASSSPPSGSTPLVPFS